ncbi:nicotinamide mononucleotide transporter [Halopseudomonas litoralis]|uniref:Nicotinamide riboside transporter PnuC n=1 Tax=Halopseudomonas litoralis TaxID=797277 RepID=A0A1H1PPP3_9GAMM|nr:nicotinamide riboside transporter PnuC [Halopseudomonas litoralis]SDS13272.1 nicotinamide mononucleotide transporter [Halopseudomonas litoralis]
MTSFEIIAALLGAVSVWLTVRQNPLCWPVGLGMVLMYAWFFQSTGLYSQVLLHLVYAAVQVYGWWQWTRGGIRQPLQVTSVSPRGLLLGGAAACLISMVLGAAMAGFTDAVHPRLDATLVAFSLLAQFWMALKRVQCWLLWLVLDIAYVALFLYQGYYPTAALYCVFVLLAAMGWRQWRAAQAVAP